MPQIHIACEDWYPVYRLYRPGDYGDFAPYEVPQALIDRWDVMFESFQRLQSELAVMYHG